MKTSYAKNPRKLLGCFMALAMAFFTTSTAIAEDLIITVGGGSWTSEVSWEITDATGASLTGVQYVGSPAWSGNIPSGCYDMNMYDSFGDGWNGSTYSIADSTTGQIYATGGLTAGSFGVDQVCWGVTGGCTDPAATNYDSTAAFDDGSCLYASCTNLYLNMYDSFGDGWNGNTFTLTNSVGAVSFSATLATGASGIDSVCLPDDCYTVACAGGSWAAEVSWTLVDGSGAVLASGGSPASGSVCLPAVFGCTDPAASNYDPAANTDDGSCSYPCIAADTSESFEASSFGAWYNDPANTLDWIVNSGGTSSSNTGPSAAFDGVNYIYTETSGAGSNKIAAIHTDCIDLSAWTDPAFVFAYHMFGATMGTVNVDVSTDGGATWTNEWTMSGDQGNAWSEAVVSLSGYSGQVSVRVQALTGTSFTSDMAVDLLRFMEAPVSGCTDPVADNYDPLATIDDGSCLYTGCMDPMATNYCAICNVSDSTLCVYPQCNALDFCDDFEAFNLSANGWVVLPGSEPGCVVQLDSTWIAPNDVWEIMMTGADGPAGWTQYSTEAQAFANTSHVSTATICLDMTSSAGNVNMTFDYQTQSGFTNTAPGLLGTAYSTMRVKVNGTVLQDINGTSWHGSETRTSLTYDLSAYAGQSSVYVTFESACKYNANYSSGAFGDFVWVDNVCAFNVNPCTYYGIAADYAFDASCNGGTDGMASATVNGLDPASTYTNVYSWTDAAGNVVGTTNAVSGLAAGTYTCTVSDATNGCSASTSVTIGEPTAIVASGAVLDATSPIASDGAVTLSVAGGTPCYTGANDTLNTWDGGTSYIYSSVATGTTVYFDIIATNASGITGFSQYGVYTGIGDVEVWTRSGSADGNCTSSAGWTLNTSFANPATVNGSTVYIPLLTPVGMEAGDTIGVAIHTPTTHYFTLGGNGAFTNIHASNADLSVSTGAVDANGPTFGGSAFLGSATASYNPQVDVHYTAPGYTFAWSNGATTQNVSALPMGPIGVTVTDCNGCTGTWNGFIAANVVLGCTDPNAANYDPAANTDDGSCQYPGCTDSLATNFDPTANTDDGSCTYSCAYQGYNNEINITVFTDLTGDEASWSVISSNGDTVGAVPTGGYSATSATYVHPLCADNGCYVLNWGDLNGDGWSDWNGTQGWILATDVNGDTLSYQVVTAANANGSAALSLGGVACSIGCTDSAAVNYDPAATIDDGSCAYCNDNFFTLNMYDSFGDGWNGNMFTMTNSAGAMFVNTTLASGSFASENLCLATDCWTISCDGGAWQAEVSWELVDVNGTIVLSGGAPYTGNICLPAVPGCTDSAACNYDPLANTDNGTCDYSCYGCTDPAAINYDPLMTIDDGSCQYCSLSASTIVVDETAAGAYDGAVDLTVTGTYCVTTTDLFVSVAGGNGQSGNAFNLINTSGGDLYIEGFSQGPASGNQSATGVAMEVFCCYADYTAGTPTWTSVATATVDLTANATTGYVSIPGGVTIPAGATYGFWVGSSTTTVQYTNGTGTVGVTPWASDANVTITEGHGGTFPTGLNFSPRNWNGTVHYGDPAVSAYSYAWSTGDTTEDLTNVTSGTYTVNVTDCYGCTTSASATVTVNMVPGCTDPTAFNYNPSANFDDGSCIPVVDGCTDSLAANYDPLANTDDGSCFIINCAAVINAPFTETFDVFGNIGPFTDAFISGGNTSATANWGWTQQTGGTGSFGTGPTTDVSGTGYYMYTETSGAGSNKTAVLYASCINVDSLTTPAMQFSYHMLGATMGTLEIRINGDSVWAMSGDQGADWNQGQVSLPSGQGDLFVEFVGFTGTSFTSDMAIDEVSVGEAIVIPVYGCTDSLASNFDPLANTDDSTCIYCSDNFVTLDVTTGSFPTEIGWYLTNNLGDTVASATAPNGTGSFPLCLTDDCYTMIMTDTWGDGWNGATWTLGNYGSGTLASGTSGTADVSVNVSCALPGCTDPAASNYDPAATQDDGSCCYGDFATLNMFDSFGDGWNGNYFTMTNVVDGSVVFNSTLATGTSGTDGACVPVGCYDIVVNGGSWQAEVSWDLTDGAGNIVASGGAPYSGQIAYGDSNACNIGCTDSTALNYDPNAMYDDGSCAYPCLDNQVYITVNTDYYGGECSWDITDDASGAVVASGGPYGIGYNTVNDSVCLADGCYTLNMFDSFGDGWSTGILGSVDVTDGMGGTYANGTLPTGTSASFGFTIGTTYGCTDTAASNYDACANTDDGSCIYPCAGNDVTITVGGGSWLSEVSWDLVDGSGTIVLSGGAPYSGTACLPNDCYTMNMYDSFGDGWNGSTYSITDNATGTVYGTGGLLSGASGSDLISIGAACPVYGCTDSTAINYDPLATSDDGSCIYPAPCNSETFCDDFESGDFVTGNWIATAGAEAEVYVASAGAFLTNGGSFSASFAGGGFAGWTGGSSTTTSAQAWANTDHISQIEMCLDLSTVASGSAISMVLDYNSTTYFGASSGNYSYFRVLVNGDSIPDQNGNYDHYAPGQLNLAYDLAAYAGTNPSVTLQASCKYGSTYNAGAYSDIVFIDNICIVAPVYGCTDANATNYNPQATIDDGSCVYPPCAAMAPYHQEFSTGVLPIGVCTPNQWATSATAGNWAFTGTPGYTAGANGRTAGTYAWIDFSGTDNGVILEVEDVDVSALSSATLFFDYFSDDGGSMAGGVANTMHVEAYDGASWNSIATMQILTPGWNTYSFSLAGYTNGNIAEIRFRGESNGASDDFYNDLLLDDVKIDDYSIPGCMDSLATNYNPQATSDDGSCTYSCAYYGLDEVFVTLYDSYGDGWNGNTLTVDGTDFTLASGSVGTFTACVDLSTCITATYNATGSWTSENSWDITDANGTVLLSGGNVGSGGDFGNCGTPGCTDSTACNYDPAATIDDGSCLTAYGCTDPAACNYDSLATCDDGSCLTVYGCTDSTAFNYDPNATCNDGSCQAVVYGCTDPTALNYSPAANTPDPNNPCCYVAGCTDPNASNYDPNACIDDGSCVPCVYGCTDPNASNYDPNATCDDGTCLTTTCNEDAPTGLYTSGVIQNRATIHWDNMNSSVCVVDQYRIRYREVGTNSWSTKTMGQPVGSCLWACNKVEKLILNLTPATTYEYQMKAWYCGGGNSAWTSIETFTTQADCPNVGNLAVTSGSTTQATFTWDDSNGAYSFMRIKARVDTLGSAWFNVGGTGVAYGTFTKNKNNLTPGTDYRAQARTWCDPNGGAYKSPTWTSLIYWTQPTSIRLEGDQLINNLDVYPNPSRDIFNVTFTSEEAQDLEVRVINVVGEVVYTENLEKFVGEYSKKVDLATYTKGVYFLEITTTNGVINKKLILQ